MIGLPRLRMRFVPTAFEGYRHWDSLELADLEEVTGPAARMICVSLMAEIVVIAGPESDLWARCGPALG